MLTGYWGSKDAPDLLIGIIVGGCRVPGGRRRSHGLLGLSFEEAPQASPAASQPHLSLLPRAPQLRPWQGYNCNSNRYHHSSCAAANETYLT